MTLPCYQVYKNSNVTWLPSIPEHWSYLRFKHVFRESGERSEDGSEELLSVSSYTGVKPKSDSLEEGDHLSRAESLEGYKVCHPNELVMNIMLAWNRGLAFSDYHGIVSPAYCVFKIIKESCPRYLNYLLRSDEFITYFKAFSSGVIDSRLRLYPETFGWLYSIFPPVVEQFQIARFLDHEVGKIDALIAEQEKLIALLKEKRQAVISHAVTKGLNPDAPMKDSGVEWLGQVPEHWVIKSYRYACKIYRGKFGHRPRNDPSLYDGEYPFIQTGDIAQAGKFIVEYKQTLNEKGKQVSQKFPAGTLVMAIAANIGDTAILEFDAYAPDSVVGFKPINSISLDFLRYSLICALPALEQTSTQSSQANLNIDRISSVLAVFPPYEEQNDIVEYLDKVLHELESLESSSHHVVSLLSERRSALISAAVTGKIDVRGWQPPAAQ